MRYLSGSNLTEAAGNVPIQGGGHREENEDALAQHVLQSVDLPSSLPTSQSYADILAGMNAGAAATLAIPMTVAHGVTMLSPSQCWSKHFVSCDGGLPLSLLRAVAIFERDRLAFVLPRKEIFGETNTQDYFV